MWDVSHILCEVVQHLLNGFHALHNHIKPIQHMVIGQGVKEPLLQAVHHHLQSPITDLVIEMFYILKEPFLASLVRWVLT